MNWWTIVIYIVLVIGVYSFIGVSRLEWNGKPLIKWQIRLAISLLLPLILIAAFMLLIYLFIVLALIVIAIFILSYVNRRRK